MACLAPQALEMNVSIPIFLSCMILKLPRTIDRVPPFCPFASLFTWRAMTSQAVAGSQHNFLL